MSRRNVFFGFCAAMLVAESIGYAQVDGPQRKLFADYFTAAENAPTGMLTIKDLEQRRLGEALLYLRQGKFNEAIQDCIQVLARFVNHPKGLAILGMAAKLMREPSLPIPYYERALQRYPRRALTQAQYGKYLAEIGKITDGIAHLNLAITSDPQLTVAYVWLARIYIQNQQPDLARQILQRKKQIVPMEASTPTGTLEAQEEKSQGGEEGANGTFSGNVNRGSHVLDERAKEEGLLSDGKNEEPPHQLEER